MLLSGMGAEAAETLTGSYSMTVDNFAPAAYSTEILLKLDQSVSEISLDELVVTERKMEPDYTTGEMVEREQERLIKEIYLCDEQGEQVDGASSFIFISMEPSSSCKSIFGIYGPYGLNCWDSTYALKIALADGATLKTENGEAATLEIDSQCTSVNVSDSVAKFDLTGSFTSESGVTYHYASYAPEEETDTLVVWLHGLGEGGTYETDPSVILLAAEADELAGEDFQNKVGGAYILAP